MDSVSLHQGTEPRSFLAAPAPVGSRPRVRPRLALAAQVSASLRVPDRHDPDDPGQVDAAGVELVGVPHEEDPQGPL